MLVRIEEASDRNKCPICEYNRLYSLKGSHFKCAFCKLKHGPKKLKDDLEVVHYIGVEVPGD